MPHLLNGVGSDLRNAQPPNNLLILSPFRIGMPPHRRRGWGALQNRDEGRGQQSVAGDVGHLGTHSSDEVAERGGHVEAVLRLPELTGNRRVHFRGIHGSYTPVQIL